MTEAAISHKPRITVIGTGYLGAVHAAVTSSLGFEVLGVDVDPRKVEMLNRGETPIYEPGLTEQLKAGLKSGRLRFTTDISEAGDFGDVHFICVGTPQQRNSTAADLSYVEAAVTGLAPHLKRKALVVGKSTVPPGTSRWVSEQIRELSPAGQDILLAWNPEFLREGFAVEDTQRPDRIVVGSDSAEAVELLRQVYAPQLADGVPFITTDLTTAELVKSAANSFLATKISFINAMAEVCESAGGDVTTLAQAIGYDDRIGKKFLRAGIGFGGGCLPKDIRSFMASAGRLGVSDALTFLREIDEINLRQRRRAIDIVRQLLGGRYVGRGVAVLGAAFKPDSDDVRDSPALDIAARLHLHGANVRVYDPAANENARSAYPTLTYVDSVEEACQGAEVTLLLTEWDEFKSLTPDDLNGIVSQRQIVDGRNVLDPVQWRDAGWTYRGFGRP